MSDTAQWTVMIYMAGHNGRTIAANRDLFEMRRVGSTDQVNVVVEFDNVGGQGIRRMQLRHHGVNETVEQPGATVAGSPDMLVAFITWCAHHYPARRYALILWNHGGGWSPNEVARIALSAQALAFSPTEAAQRCASPIGRALFRSTLHSILCLRSPHERAISADDGSSHVLDTLELGRVLDVCSRSLGQPIDVLGMDACFTSNIEVAYQLRARVRYLVASEDIEPTGGWPYALVLGLFAERPQATTRAIVDAIVSACVASQAQRHAGRNVTQTALDLSCLDRLTGSIDRLAEALLADMTNSYAAIWTAQRNSTRFAGNTLWDIGHFCAQLAQCSAGSRVRDCAQAVVEAHAVGPLKPLVAHAHRGHRLERCHGTSVYLVPPMKDISRYYAGLDFATDFRWLAMLRAYHDA